MAKDKNIEGILAILTPQYMTDATAVAEKLKDFWILITFIPITSISFIFGLMKGLILKLIGKN